MNSFKTRVKEIAAIAPGSPRRNDQPTYDSVISRNEMLIDFFARIGINMF